MSTKGTIRQGILIGLLMVGAAGAGMTMQQPRGEPLALEVATAVPTPTAAPTSTAAPVVVFVSGAVREPGVYTLPPGSRVVDALAAAGGPTDAAATEALNQALLLSDSMQIHMPEQSGEPALIPAISEPASESSGTPAEDGMVRVNSANAAALEELPRIGRALAERIIAYREAHGPFTSVEELDNVSGIGPAVLEGIRPFIIID